MSPEETFEEIARLLNKLLEFEEEHDFGVNVEGVVPTYLLGHWNDAEGRMEVVSHLYYDLETGRYETHQGDYVD